MPEFGNSRCQILVTDLTSSIGGSATSWLQLWFPGTSSGKDTPTRSVAVTNSSDGALKVSYEEGEI